jgi:hypothetical protein
MTKKKADTSSLITAMTVVSLNTANETIYALHLEIQKYIELLQKQINKEDFKKITLILQKLLELQTIVTERQLTLALSLQENDSTEAPPLEPIQKH